MDIDRLLEVPDSMADELSFHKNEVSIITRVDPDIISENDEIDMAENPDIFGLYVSKDHPLLQPILDLIYNYDKSAEDNNDMVVDVIDIGFTESEDS